MKRLLVRALMLVACVGFCCLVFCVPVMAFADDSSANAQDVVLSSENDAARYADAAFALSDFSRAQVGSNRDLNDEYCGYSYYVASTPDKLVAISSETDVVVYVPESMQQSSGFALGSTADAEALKAMIVALDEANANGGAVLSLDSTWHFTSDATYVLDGVEYRFGQELKNGQYYASVIGEDGSDVTDSSNPLHVSLKQADFGSLVPSEDAVIAEAPSGFAAVADFLSRIDYSPLWVTLKTTGVAIVFIFVLGLAAAYFCLRISPRAQDVADAIFTIPMVLPPTVCGFLLLLLLGKNTAFGQFFIDIGFPLIFSWPATVIAAVVVAFPLMYRSARGAFESLDPNMLDCARTLGWSNAKIFFKIMLPLSWGSIAAGTVLAFARALGEFGATLFLAGNYLGITRTIPIAIYFEWMNGNTDIALFWTGVILVFSFIVIMFINLWSRRTTKFRKRVEK